MRWGFTLAVMLCCSSVLAGEYPEVVKLDSGCSGVVVSQGGLLMTARHCGAQEMVHATVAGKQVTAKLIYASKDAVDGPVVYQLESGTYKFVKVGEKIPEVGEPVYCVGYAGKNAANKVKLQGKIMGGNVLSEGVFGSSLRVNQADFPAMRGMSGCPLFNAKNEVIGLLHGGDGRNTVWLSFGATRKSFDEGVKIAKQGNAPAPDEHRKPIVWVFGSPKGQCAPCDALKADVEAGHFKDYDVRFVEWDGKQWSNPQVCVAFAKATGQTSIDSRPTIWPDGSSEFQTGYDKEHRNRLLEWLGAIFRSLVRVALTILGQQLLQPPMHVTEYQPLPIDAPAPPPASDAKAPDVSLEPVPEPSLGDSVEVMDPDFTGVRLVGLVAAQELGMAGGTVARVALDRGIGPAKRKLGDIFHQKVDVDIIPQRTQPARFESVCDAAEVQVDKFYLIALVPRKLSGLEGVLARKLAAAKVDDLLSNLGDFPIEIILADFHPDVFDKVVAVVSTPYEEVYERSPAGRDSGSLLEVLDKVKALKDSAEKTRADVAAVQSEVSSIPKEQQKPKPFNKGILSVLAGLGALLLERLQRRWSQFRGVKALTGKAQE